MIYINLFEKKVIDDNPKYKHIQNEIINFVKTHIRNNNFNYVIIYHKKYIIEDDLINIKVEDFSPIEEDDVMIWHPHLVYFNLDLVTTYRNSVVILEKESVLIQKVSENNPVNEASAINNGFFLLYLQPEKEDVTNDNWKIVINKNVYLTNIEDFVEKLRLTPKNFKRIGEDIPEIFEPNTIINKIQINLD